MNLPTITIEAGIPDLEQCEGKPCVVTYIINGDYESWIDLSHGWTGATLEAAVAATVRAFEAKSGEQISRMHLKSVRFNAVA
jgi:hypothetical protein